MTLIATEPPPPPPPAQRKRRPPSFRPIWVLGMIPLLDRISVPWELWPGFTVVLSGIWATATKWKTLEESKPEAGWFVWRVGFAVIALRIDW